MERDTYTPSTGYVESVFVGSDLGHSYDGSRATFRRWLAAHDREVAARALREAARAWQAGGWADDWPRIVGMAQRAADWMRTRAARIENGETL